MSGGSYEYLCHKDENQLLGDYTHIGSMAEALATIPNGSVAAQETQALADYIDRVRMRVAVRMRALQPVWRAVEWVHSGDSSPEEIQRALRTYHDEAEAP